jgi:enoyl-CoA hydratase/carnithine racemase
MHLRRAVRRSFDRSDVIPGGEARADWRRGGEAVEFLLRLSSLWHELALWPFRVAQNTFKLDRPAMDAVWRDFYGLMNALASSPIPIAPAITGHAPAGGTVRALFCDWRIAAEGDCKIGLSEVQVDLPLPPVILSALRRLVGARPAERLAVTGLLVSPSDAAMLGLVDEVVRAEQVVDRAIK